MVQVPIPTLTLDPVLSFPILRHDGVHSSQPAHQELEDILRDFLNLIDGEES
jgi:hypothetical protein